LDFFLNVQLPELDAHLVCSGKHPLRGFDARTYKQLSRSVHAGFAGGFVQLGTP
jgi:hypothetical protein